MNLYETIRAAGGGEAFRTLAAQFGLSEEQVRKAVEAFLPAFSTGLKRSAADPFGLMELMRRLASGEFVNAWQNPAWAAGSGRRQGEDALAFVFGSPETVRAVAEQAAAFTGLAREKLEALFPALAALAFGGLAGQAAAANPALDAMLKAFRAETPKPAAKGPLDRYEEEQERKAFAAGDLAKAQEEMMRAGLAAFQAGSAAWRDALASAATSGDAKRPEAASGRDVFGELFEPGLKLSEGYAREVEALLDRLRPESTRSRGRPTGSS